MANSKTFMGIDSATWQKMKAMGTRDHGTAYSETSEQSGTATTRTPVGDVVLEYALDPQAQAVTYTIKQKPFLVAASLIWNGIESSIATVRNA
jgi:hypothetical protein